MFTFPICHFSGKKPAEVIYRTAVASSSSATLNISSVAIGAASSDRYVIIASMGYNARSISSITVNGNSATLIYSQASNYGHFYGINVPTGTTCNISITYSGTNPYSVVGVYTATGLESLTPLATHYSHQGTPYPVTLTGSDDVPEDGFIICQNFRGTSGSGITASWTNATETYDMYNAYNVRQSGAYRNSTGSAVTASYSPQLDTIDSMYIIMR